MQKRIDGGIIIGSENDMEDVMDTADMGCPFALVDYNLNKMNKKKRKLRLCALNAMDFEGSFLILEY